MLLFLLIPGMSAIAPFLVYPAITARFGPTGFAAIAIGQSIGATVAIICELGWSVVGPQAVARSNPDEVSALHRVSVATKSIALAIGIPVAAILGFVVPTDYRVAASATAVSIALSALSPVWLLTGLNRPAVILGADVVPRMVLNLAAALGITLGAPLAVFAFANGISVAISLLVARQLVAIAIWPRRGDYIGGRAVIREHLALMLGRCVSVAYTTLLTTIIGAILPSAVALYAATDRLLRMGLSVLSGVPARLQSWLGQAPENDLTRRTGWSLITNTLVGLLAGVVFFLAAPPAGGLLFAGTIRIPPFTAALGALVAFAVCTSRGIGLSLVAVHHPNAIASASVAATCVGLLTAMLAIPTLGADGGLLSALVAESLGIIIQAFALARTLRSRSVTVE